MLRFKSQVKIKSFKGRDRNSSILHVQCLDTFLPPLIFKSTIILTFVLSDFLPKVLNQCRRLTEEIQILHDWHRLKEGEEEEEDRRKDSQHTCFMLWGGGWGGALTERGRGLSCAYGSRFIYSRSTTIMITLNLWSCSCH